VRPEDVSSLPDGYQQQPIPCLASSGAAGG
jgi:hypothetical protein